VRICNRGAMGGGLRNTVLVPSCDVVTAGSVTWHVARAAIFRHERLAGWTERRCVASTQVLRPRPAIHPKGRSRPLEAAPSSSFLSPSVAVVAPIRVPGGLGRRVCVGV
jgi:hypothetical protein